MQSIASSICNCTYSDIMIGASLATRYRNNGFLELVCVCGTAVRMHAAMPHTCGHGARPARANSVTVTHF